MGALLGWSYRKSSGTPTRALHVFYPVLLAEIPHLIRTDALGGIKSILYPMLMLWVAFRLARMTEPLGGPDERPPASADARGPLAPANAG